MGIECYLLVYYFVLILHTPGRRESKRPILSRNVDQKSIEAVFLIAICPPTGDKYNHKHCFYQFLIRVRQLLIMFSIDAYPV